MILEEDADLTYITDTSMGREGGVSLTLTCPPDYAVQDQGRPEGQGGVAVVYKNTLEVVRSIKNLAL